jgi:predicted transposase/invertase (TIGR01784 family)
LTASSDFSGDLKQNRKSVFDIHCKDAAGNYFIIEVQKLSETYFKDRSVYYSTFPIRSQEKKGEWNFELKHIYTICLLNFCFDDSDPNRCIHEVKLLELNTKKVFYDRLTFYYAELPKFNKTKDQLVTREDKWLYVLVNLKKLKEIPLSLQDDPIFKQFFMDAKTAHLTELELQAYYNSKKAEWDEYAANETAMNKGELKGIEKGAKEKTISISKALLQNTPLSIEEIARLTEADIDFVNEIKNSLDSI